MDDKTLKDILVICKGWYNKEKYPNALKAMNAYYHKYYGCEDIEMDKAFAIHLFLTPLVLKAIKIEPTLARYIFEPSYSIVNNNENYVDIMYSRMLALIQMIEHNTFDLSDYEEMFNKAEKNHYTDKTIGII